MMKDDRGHLLFYAALTIAIVTLLVAGILMAGAAQGGQATSDAVGPYAAAALAALLVLGGGFRRNLPAASGYCAVWCLLAALMPALYAIFDTSPHPVAAGVAGLLGVAFVACVALPRLLSPRYPDVLAARFGKRAVGEHEGIQFLHVAPASVCAGEWCSFSVHLQNCWDAPRTFVLRLEPPANQVGLLRFPREAKAELRGLEVGVLSIPVWADGNARPGPVQIRASPSTSGWRGRRRRTAHAREVEEKVSTTKTVAWALGGALAGHVHIHVGGGFSMETQVSAPVARQPVGPEDGIAREARFTSVWLPEKVARAGLR
jgi:hypothetical protein